MNRAIEKFIETLFFLAAMISGLMICAIFGFLLIPGLPLFSDGRFLSILTGPWAPHLGQFGIYPMITSTLAITLLAMVFAFPLSLGCAALISIESKTRFSRGFRRLLRKIVEMMTGVPTVVYGFIGIFLLVPLVRNIFHTGSGMCILSAALMLTLLVSPTMILLFSDSFESVPRKDKEAVLAIGGTAVQQFLYVTLPYARPGILVGATLACGRALGDTLIALMIAGNAVQVPGSWFDSARTLTAHIALVFAADYHSPEFQAIFVCAMILYLFSGALAMTARRIHDRRKIRR